MAAQEYILVIKHGALGDIVIATAGFAAIRAEHPEAHIVLLTTKAYAPLLAQSPYFNEIWVDSKPKWHDRKALGRLRSMLRSQRWSFVYDLQTSTRSTFYQWLLAKPWPRISNVSRYASHGYTDPARHKKHAHDNLIIQLAIAGMHEVGMPDISWLHEEMGAGDFGLGTGKAVKITTIDETDDSAQPPAPSPQPYALLVPGGAAHRPKKRWPAEQYASVAQELVEKKITPVLIGTNAEAEALANIAARVPQAINLCGKTSFGQLAALARGAKLALGNDTGPMHIIASAGCPSTVLFSYESDPVRSAPKGRSVKILRVPDLRQLEVDRVLATLPALSEFSGANSLP